MASRPVSESLKKVVSAQMTKRESAARNSKASPDSEFSNEDLKRYAPTMNTPGMIYSPQELSFEAKRPMQAHVRQSQLIDKFEEYKIHPMDEYKSSNLLSYFVTDMGRIQPRLNTGLSAKSQRRLGKAVRRARALSLLPTTARHSDYYAANRRPTSHSFIARGK